MTDQTPGLALKVPDGNLGPAMRALPTDRQRAFVLALFTLGTADYTKAARAAGYGGENPDNVRFIAHRIAHDDRVQAAIQEEARRRLHAGAITAVGVIHEAMADPDRRVALKAAHMLLDRAGLHPTTEHKVTVDNKSEAEALRDVKAILTRMGLSVDLQRKFLEHVGVVDVEFEEVDSPSAKQLPPPGPARARGGPGCAK